MADESGERKGARASHLPVAARTDVGRVRRNNEDAFRYDEEAGLYVVCDGMGGMAAGEVASRIAAETVLQEFLRLHTSDPDGSVEDRLDEAIAAANRAVLDAAREPGRAGMATTLVAAAVVAAASDNELWHLLVANVGDSRAYLLHAGTCRQITRDHSYAKEVQRIHGLAAEEIPAAEMLRFGALITRAIGASLVVEPEFFQVPFASGDVLLLATDGLTSYFDDPQDLFALVDSADLQGSCAALLAAANAAGGADNITALVLSRPDLRDEGLPY